MKGLKNHSYYALFLVVNFKICLFFSSCFFLFFVVHALILNSVCSVALSAIVGVNPNVA